MVLAFNTNKLDKAIKTTQKYLKEHGQKDNPYAKDYRTLLRFLKKIESFSTSKEVSNILIIKDKHILSLNFIHNYLKDMDIKHDFVMKKGRTYVGGYVNKTVDCYIYTALIMKLRKIAPSHG